MSFKEGDVVKLKSGGPKMTVTSVGDQLGTPSVWCSWFTAGKNNAGVFPLGAVEIVSDNNDGPQPLSVGWVAARRRR
jgi:uncharacterized protein YodC (DUF2158 family)